MHTLLRNQTRHKDNGPTVEERVRAARVLLSLVGRQERRGRGEPELQVVDGGRGRAA